MMAINEALDTAIRNWHTASRAYEQAGRLFNDAQAQLQHAERDLHELAGGLTPPRAPRPPPPRSCSKP